MEKIQFIEKVDSFIKKHNLLRNTHRVLVALSGGADSVALLCVLKDLGVDVVAAHCNFHLRGDESLRDENFVRELTSASGVDCHFIDFDVYSYSAKHHLSLEMACRELRYDFFRIKSEEVSAGAIAVAHHRDDNAETFFLNILRGTGITGLAGIKPRNGNIIRPLLDVRRADIEDYLRNKGIGYVVDSTNGENDFKRNKLRNIILPQIRESFDGADIAIANTISNCEGCLAVYKDAIDKLRMEIVSVNGHKVVIDGIKLTGTAAPETVLYEFVKEPGFNADQVAGMLAALSRSNTGAHFISGTHEAVIARGMIEIMPISEEALEERILKIEGYGSHVEGDLRITLKRRDDGFKIVPSSSVAYLDARITGCDLRLRRWKEGDKFIPFGMKGYKKLSNLFVDKKLSLLDKRNVRVVTADGEIVWVVGIRASDKFRIDEMTSDVVVMEVLDSNA